MTIFNFLLRSLLTSFIITRHKKKKFNSCLFTFVQTPLKGDSDICQMQSQSKLPTFHVGILFLRPVQKLGREHEFLLYFQEHADSAYLKLFILLANMMQHPLYQSLISNHLLKQEQSLPLDEFQVKLFYLQVWQHSLLFRRFSFTNEKLSLGRVFP